jgi:hypothetical protein
MRTRRIQSVEISLSYRLHESAGPCCYVVTLISREHGQPSIHASEHIVGRPEQVVDRALTLARQLSYEEFLTLCEPF